MITTATLVAVIIDIAIGSRAWKAIASHKTEDAVAHQEFRGRLLAIESHLPSGSPVGFHPAGLDQKVN